MAKKRPVIRSSDPENVERRKRYASDPEYRARRRSHNKPWTERKKLDPSALEKGRKSSRAWREKNLAYAREAARKWREQNRELSREIVKRGQRKLRADFLVEYGSKCVCCGETEEVFLTIEHTFGDGGVIRKKLGGSDKAVLRDLRNRGWPKDEGITILCWNCNTASRFGRTCPHKGKILDERSKVGSE